MLYTQGMNIPWLNLHETKYRRVYFMKLRNSSPNAHYLFLNCKIVNLTEINQGEYKMLLISFLACVACQVVTV